MLWRDRNGDEMSETLPNNNEALENNTELSQSSLEKEAGNFDPEKAMEAREEKEQETAEKEAGDLYDREYRENVNAPQIDLFTKRRIVIEEQFPALKRLSFEDLRRYNNDRDFQEKIDRERSKVPEDVTKEHNLLGHMVTSLEEGIDAYYTPDHPWANREPFLVPAELAADGYEGMVSTRSHVEDLKKDLAEMQKLHEKNSSIIDFSHEDEIDIDTIPEELQSKFEEIEHDVEAARSADFSFFEPHGNHRPESFQIDDKIVSIDLKDLSYAVKKELIKKLFELDKRYMEAYDAAEIRSIDARISELQQEK